jgi:hypothetical protein
MPTVGVKAELLFERLGRRYSEFNLVSRTHSLMPASACKDYTVSPPPTTTWDCGRLCVPHHRPSTHGCSETTLEAVKRWMATSRAHTERVLGSVGLALVFSELCTCKRNMCTTRSGGSRARSLAHGDDVVCSPPVIALCSLYIQLIASHANLPPLAHLVLWAHPHPRIVRMENDESGRSGTPRKRRAGESPLSAQCGGYGGGVRG